MNTYVRLIYRLTDLLGAIACALLILLVLMISYNVIARYVFSLSSISLQELSWHFYASIFLLGIPYALRHGAHVRVDVIYDRLSKPRQLLIDFIGTLILLIPVCLVVIWTGWNFTTAAYQLGSQPSGLGEFFSMLVNEGIGEKSQDPGGLLNRWVIKLMIPLSFFFLLLTSIAIAIEKLQAYQDGANAIKTGNTR